MTRPDTLIYADEPGLYRVARAGKLRGSVEYREKAVGLVKAPVHWWGNKDVHPCQGCQGQHPVWGLVWCPLLTQVVNWERCRRVARKDTAKAYDYMMTTLSRQAAERRLQRLDREKATEQKQREAIRVRANALAESKSPVRRGKRRQNGDAPQDQSSAQSGQAKAATAKSRQN